MQPQWERVYSKPFSPPGKLVNGVRKFEKHSFKKNARIYYHRNMLLHTQDEHGAGIKVHITLGAEAPEDTGHRRQREPPTMVEL
jgi:hypothetical protein